MNITFAFWESLKSETFPESLSKMQLWGPKYHTKGIDQRKLVLIFWHFLDRRQRGPVRLVLLEIIVWLVTQFSQKQL